MKDKKETYFLIALVILYGLGTISFYIDIQDMYKYNYNSDLDSVKDFIGQSTYNYSIYYIGQYWLHFYTVGNAFLVFLIFGFDNIPDIYEIAFKYIKKII